MEFTINNDAKTIANSIKNQFSDFSLEDLEIIVDRYKEADVWQDEPFLEENFYNTLIDLLKENKIIDKSAPYNNLVNNINE